MELPAINSCADYKKPGTCQHFQVRENQIIFTSRSRKILNFEFTLAMIDSESLKISLPVAWPWFTSTKACFFLPLYLSNHTAQSAILQKS